MIHPLPEFTPDELMLMHRYCLQYRGHVRGGKVPSREQDNRFLIFQRVTHATGVACG